MQSSYSKEHGRIQKEDATIRELRWTGILYSLARLPRNRTHQQHCGHLPSSVFISSHQNSQYWQLMNLEDLLVPIDIKA